MPLSFFLGRELYILAFLLVHFGEAYLKNGKLRGRPCYRKVIRMNV